MAKRLKIKSDGEELIIVRKELALQKEEKDNWRQSWALPAKNSRSKKKRKENGQQS